MTRSSPSKANGLKTGLIRGVGGGLLTALMHSTRSELIQGHEVEARYFGGMIPAVYVLWHGRLLSCAFRYRKHWLGTLITQNRDGEYIAGAIRSWGYTVVRGSSSRGGSSALRAIVRLLRSGVPVALTPDGPRGPRQKMKLGPLVAAQMAGVPVVPVSAGASSGWYSGGWDRFLVPRPFAWTPIAMGEPVMVDPVAGEEHLVTLAADIEGVLNDLTCTVDDAARAGRG